MGIEGVRRNGEFLALNQVALALGVDSHVPGRWVAKGWLHVHHASDSGEVRFVSYEALRRFAVTYPGEVAKGKPDVVWLIGILVPPSGGDTREHAGSRRLDRLGTAAGTDWITGEVIKDRAAAN